MHPCADSININNKVWNMYFRDLLPRLVKTGDDGNYGSAAVCDALCLQVWHSTSGILSTITNFYGEIEKYKCYDMNWSPPVALIIANWQPCQ